MMKGLYEMTFAEIAQYFRIGKSGLYKMAKEEEILAVKIKGDET